MAHLKVNFNKDGTMTIRLGRHVEHVTIIFMSREEIFERIKWASISKGGNLTDIMITEIMQELKKE
jgi:hypothetical protein